MFPRYTLLTAHNYFANFAYARGAYSSAKRGPSREQDENEFETMKKMWSRRKNPVDGNEKQLPLDVY